jgi:hypothetical protein
VDQQLPAQEMAKQKEEKTSRNAKLRSRTVTSVTTTITSDWLDHLNKLLAFFLPFTHMTGEIFLNYKRASPTQSCVLKHHHFY